MELSPKKEDRIFDLLAVMALLRSENGCPWDRAQTHASIRQNVVEEAYEVADAIDRGDDTALCEELGDLLLQVVFHSRLAEEEGAFTFAEVADGICQKLIYRHPHVFGNLALGAEQDAYALWDARKAEEKGQKTATERLSAVPRTFPALMRAQKLLKRAAAAGLSLPEANEAAASPSAACDALLQACENGGDGKREAGALLLAAVDFCRAQGIDAEEALDAANERYLGQFEQAETLARECGLSFADATGEQKRALWQAAEERLLHHD